MKVLLISHNCQSLTEGLPKAQFIGETAGVDLRVLVPNRWNHYGQLRRPEKPINPSYERQIGKVIWPWVGPAQFYLHWYPGLPKLLSHFQPDIINLWGEPWSLVSAQVCWLRNKLLPSTKIVSETEQNIDKTLPPPFENFRSYTLRNTDFIVGRNEESIHHLRRKGYSGSARVVPNAVDTELFQPLSSQKRRETRQNLGFEGFVAGYVGRLVPEKGLMEMIETLPLLPTNICVAFIGEGSYSSQLQARAIELGVTSRVKFCGARPMTELPPLMAALDVLVLPSRTTPSWKEQFGRVLIEAGACEVPIIGSDSGAIPEVVGEAGLIFPEGDVHALAKAIEKFHSQPDWTKKITEAGRHRVEEQFTWKGVAHQMTEIYAEVLS